MYIYIKKYTCNILITALNYLAPGIVVLCVYCIEAGMSSCCKSTKIKQVITPNHNESNNTTKTNESSDAARDVRLHPTTEIKK